MNEAETRAELIDPILKNCGWNVVEHSRIMREYNITAGKIQTGGGRAKKLTADYVLVYKGIKLAVIEAKSNDCEVGEGVMQAKLYAEKLQLDFTFATNGKEIYEINLKTGAERFIDEYPTPEVLWNKIFEVENNWRDKFNEVPFENIGGTKPPRFYQEIAVNNVLEAVANKKNRILLTLATSTGKTTIAFHIAWKLFQTRWNLKWDSSRRPRILFLADRNVLSNQAFGEFTKYSAFADDALVRISPKAIRDLNEDGKTVEVNTFITNPTKNKVRVPTNGNLFFTIFQTFMTGDNVPNFGEYPPDYFDFIIIDECHRGGANDEGNWRSILAYFSPAVQLGLTATPKRKDNTDTYKYFGEPVYIYSLKEGINDGFLTPFKIKRIQTTLDDYTYISDDKIIEGEVEEGKNYVEKDFNKIIEIKEREAKRVKIYMDDANQHEKAIIFCATQDHAAAVRDLVNQYKKSSNPNYCVRVTANDGEVGEQFLREFQDNEKTIPTILTTSQKLSTGVDARNIRNIVLMRPVEQIIEFKQIVGRGTRLFDGKDFFTIYDFVNAYQRFFDPEWDGEPLEPETTEPKPYPIDEGPSPNIMGDDGGKDENVKRKKLKIKLKDGKEREIQHMVSTSFWSTDGKPITSQEFLDNLFGALPGFFKSEEELRVLWSNPLTRKTLLEKLDEAGFGKDELTMLQKLIDAEKSDLFDVLEYVFNSDRKPITREARVATAQAAIFALLSSKQKDFIEFVLSKYIETGVEELNQDKLPILLTNKYFSLGDAVNELGEVSTISNLFVEFQKHLYAKMSA
jgi:type I restriction enzyme, R subunit